MFRILTLSLILAGAWPAAGQTASVSGPVTGIVYDAPASSLRPVLGFPGSTCWGQPVLTDLESAFVAPNGDSALVIENGRAALVRGLRGGHPARYPVPGLMPRIDYVSWSRNGFSLAAYSATSRSLQRLDLAAAPPSAGAMVDLSYIEGDVAGVATSHDAAQTVVAVRHPAHGGFYAMAEGGPAWLLSATREPGAATFAASSNELYLVDRETSRILRFADGISGGGETLSFAGETGPLSDPVAAALSPGGERLYVALGAGRAIREYDLASRKLLREIPTGIVPEQLAPLGAGGSVFILTRPASREQPAWLLDLRGEAGISFIPAGE